jgi:hypothetical protein
MRQDKQSAIKLRKEGKSYKQISSSLSIPKSTLSGWFGGVLWSEKTKKQLAKIARVNSVKRMTAISHRTRAIRQKDYYTKQVEAKKQFTKFIKERLFIAGLMLYWGEGDSKLDNGIIRATNSDPLMIRLYYKFLKTYFSEISDKAKMYLVLYPDLNEEICKKYWSTKVGLPLDRFIKSSFIKGKHPSKRLAHGIGTLTINSRAYKEKIITWVGLIKNENI